MSRRLPKDELESIRIRDGSHAPYAYEAAPRDRRALLAEVDRLQGELERLRTQGQQGTLFVMAGHAES